MLPSACADRFLLLGLQALPQLWVRVYQPRHHHPKVHHELVLEAPHRAAPRGCSNKVGGTDGWTDRWRTGWDSGSSTGCVDIGTVQLVHRLESTGLPSSSLLLWPCWQCKGLV